MAIISYVGSLGGPGPELNNSNPVPRPLFELFNSRSQLHILTNLNIWRGGPDPPPPPGTLSPIFKLINWGRELHNLNIWRGPSPPIIKLLKSFNWGRELNNLNNLNTRTRTAPGTTSPIFKLFNWGRESNNFFIIETFGGGPGPPPPPGTLSPIFKLFKLVNWCRELHNLHSLNIWRGGPDLPPRDPLPNN